MNSIKTMLLGIAILIVAVYIKQEGIFQQNEEFIIVVIGSVLTLTGFIKNDLDGRVGILYVNDTCVGVESMSLLLRKEGSLETKYPF